jgi:tetratricopeptide (TPR) repeat protein
MSSPLLLGIWIAVLVAGAGAAVWIVSRRRLERALATVEIQNQAEDALEAGDLASAERLFKDALRLGRQAKLGQRANAAAAHWGLYRVEYERQNWLAALRHCKLARSEAVQAEGAADDAIVCREIRQAAPQSLLDLQFLTHDWPVVVRRARAMLAKGSAAPVSELCQYLGRALVHMGRPEEAVPELERALAEIEPTDPGVALLLHDLGVAQLQAGFPEAATESFEALARYPDEDPDTRHLTGRQAALANAELARAQTFHPAT